MQRECDVVLDARRQPVVVLKIGVRDLFSIAAALREVQEELEPWEFEVRMGVDRATVADLLAFVATQYRSVSATYPPDFGPST